MAEKEPGDEMANMVNDAFPESMVLNWIVIAETVNSDERTLQMATSEGMTTWLATGMLNCANEIVINQHYSNQEEQGDGEI
jgi:hypothetical protein